MATLPPPPPPKPAKSYQLTIQPANVTITVDPAKVPYDRHGQPGSILEIALAHGVDIDHACGGVAACSTCHVIIKEGFDSIPEPTDREQDYIDMAPGVAPTSRLACQAVASGNCNITVVVPGWNRNHAREAHHD